MKKYILKIQNFSDIITNSSSELFVVKTNDSADVVHNMIKQHMNAENKFPRESGALIVQTARESFKAHLNFGIYDEENKYWHTLENTWLSQGQLYDLYVSNWGKDNLTLDENDLIISIGWNFQDTINEIIENKLCAIRIE